MKTEDIADLKALLIAIRETNEQFHAVKNIRAWAAEENVTTKKLIDIMSGKALDIIAR